MKQEEIERLAEKIKIDRAAINHERILTDELLSTMSAY